MTDTIGIVANAIGNLGVPIACAFFAFYLWDKERREHKEEVNKLAEAIENNTIIMTKLVEKLSD